METSETNKTGRLGFKILMGLMVLMIGGLAFAGIATYLSNTAQTSVTVSSPMSIDFAELPAGTPANETTVTSGLAWSSDLALTGIVGLDTIDLGVKVKNKSEVDISNKTMLVTVSNDLSNVDLADITSLKFFDVGASESSGNRVWQELSSYGTDNGATVTYSIPINLLTAGNEYLYPVTMTFGNVTPSEYEITATLMN